MIIELTKYPLQAPMVESPTGQGKQLAFKVILNGPAALFTLQGQQGKVKCPLVISSFWKPYIGRINTTTTTT